MPTVFLRIDPRSSEPIFEQLVHQVKDAVARGELTEGAKLPSVRELAREVSINPNTVIKAYDTLERDGVIFRRQGAGCFVTGKTNNLDTKTRRNQLHEVLRRAATEAVHLGFSIEDVRTALEKELDGIVGSKKRSGARNGK